MKINMDQRRLYIINSPIWIMFFCYLHTVRFWSIFTFTHTHTRFIKLFITYKVILSPKTVTLNNGHEAQITTTCVTSYIKIHLINQRNTGVNWLTRELEDKTGQKKKKKKTKTNKQAITYLLLQSMEAKYVIIFKTPINSIKKKTTKNKKNMNI